MRWRALCLFFLKHSKPSKSLQKLKSYDSERILLSQSGDLRVVELWVQVECKLGHKQDQIWLLNNKKNSDHGKTPRDHAVSRKKIGMLWESVSRLQFALRHFEWFCWPPNEVNWLLKDQIWLLNNNKKFGPRQNSQRSHSFKEKNRDALRVCISVAVCVTRIRTRKNENAILVAGGLVPILELAYAY